MTTLRVPGKYLSLFLVNIYKKSIIKIKKNHSKDFLEFLKFCHLKKTFRDLQLWSECGGHLTLTDQSEQLEPVTDRRVKQINVIPHGTGGRQGGEGGSQLLGPLRDNLTVFEEEEKWRRRRSSEQAWAYLLLSSPCFLVSSQKETVTGSTVTCDHVSYMEGKNLICICCLFIYSFMVWAGNKNQSRDKSSLHFKLDQMFTDVCRPGLTF